MKKITTKILIISAFFLSPFVVSAQTTDKTFQEVATELIIRLSNYALTLLVALTVLVFLYGLMKYMFKGQESDDARSTGRKLMLWGIIGLFVMVSIWSLVGLLAGVIGQNQVGVPQFRTNALTGGEAQGGIENGSGTIQGQPTDTQSGSRANTSVGRVTNRAQQLWQNFQNNASNFWSNIRGRFGARGN